MCLISKRVKFILLCRVESSGHSQNLTWGIGVAGGRRQTRGDSGTTPEESVNFKLLAQVTTLAFG